MANAAAAVEGKKEIDGLDTEDQMRWVEELLENGRLHFKHFLVEPDFVNKLVEKKVLSKFNQKQFDKMGEDNDAKVEELHKNLKTKGWENFKVARQTLYELYPQMGDKKVWDEDLVNELPVLSLKYQQLGVSDVQADGNTPNMQLHTPEDETDPDGMFSSRSNPKTSSVPVTKQEYSSLPMYNMHKKPLRGLCLLVNNEDYSKAEGLKDRRGSTVDAKRIEDLFSGLGFHVESQKNLTKLSLRRLIELLQRYKDLQKYNCFVAVFLSHGENESLNCVDGETMRIDDIINSFKGDTCPALAGTPKWFIIQACRGSEFNYEIQHDAPEDEDYEQMPEKPMSIPACADFYISYATAPGYYSFRNINSGSWFINDMCSVLHEYSQREDVNTMMTRVNRRVALGRTVEGGGSIRKQMPCHVNMLTSALFLHPMRSSDI